jgi:hypothetical protein
VEPANRKSRRDQRYKQTSPKITMRHNGLLGMIFVALADLARPFP